MSGPKLRMNRDAGVDRWKQWKTFQRGVADLSSWAQAWDFGAKGPKPGTPGSSFYTNLCFFMLYNSVPLGADAAQLAIYHALVARLGNPPVGARRLSRILRDV